MFLKPFCFRLVNRLSRRIRGTENEWFKNVITIAYLWAHGPLFSKPGGKDLLPNALFRIYC